MNMLNIKIYSHVFFLIILLNQITSAQLTIDVTTDKENYEYGETIYIQNSITNSSDTTINFLLTSYGPCQADFLWDNYSSSAWTDCLPMAQETTLERRQSRVYLWKFSPEKYGYPKHDGIQKIYGYFSYNLPPYFTGPSINIQDSTQFTAPKYIGGQLQVSFDFENDSLVSILKTDLNIEVIEHNEYYHINEIWQTREIEIDTLYNNLNNNALIRYVYYNRSIDYESVSIITSVNEEDKLPDDYYLGNAYPNPFNPITNIEFSVPADGLVTLKIYDVIGRQIAVLVNEEKRSGIYKVNFDGSNLSSGIYFYRLQARDFSETKKLVLLK